MHHKKRERGQSLKDSRAGPHAHVIPKNTDPGPGHYKHLEESMEYQKQKKIFMIPKSKRQTFIDNIEKSKRPVPGVGQYAKLESGYDRLSTTLGSLRRKRWSTSLIPIEHHCLIISMQMTNDIIGQILEIIQR